MEMDGSVALVTGGTRGIGLAIVHAYHREGATVVINGRDPERGAKTVADLGGEDRALFVAGDVSIRAEAEAVIDEAVAHFGRLDVIVNNAGGADNHAPVAELTDEAMALALQWNLWSTLYCMRRALHYMLPQGSGRIINMSSVEGKHGKPGIATYVAAKHAINGLTKSCAQEVGTQGVTVNALCPGLIETYSVQTQGRSAAEALGIQYEDLLHMFSDESAIKRLNTADEVAAMAVLLASKAGAGITGALLSIDGGSAMY